MKIANHHNQSFKKRTRLCKCFCTTLTKVKISQLCERSDLSWNRPSKADFICIFCGVGNTIEVASNIVSVRDEIGNLHKQSVLKEQDYIHVFARHLLKESSVKLVRNPISVGIDPVRPLTSVVLCGVGNTIEMANNIVS